MKLLITGAKGQLGQALCRYIEEQKLGWEILQTTQASLDITQFEQVEERLMHEQVDVVINCAAHTAVDQCEEDIENAYKVNAIGPRNLAVVCQKLGVKLVHISTDYVFSGDFNGYRNNKLKKSDEPYRIHEDSVVDKPSAIHKVHIIDEENKINETHQIDEEILTERIERANNSRPWREDDVVGPQSIYGKSKLMGEELVRTHCTKHFIIRTAWLYGEGNNFVRTMLKLSKTNKELNVVADQFGNPTYTKDLVIAIINLLQTEYYGTYHGTCEGTCSWYDFAKKIFEIKSIDVKVNPVTSEQFPRPAKRPFYSSLDNFMLKLHGMNTFRGWEEALEDYLCNEKNLST